MKTGKRKWMKGGSPERSGFDENLLKLGGPGGGAARRTSKKAKTNVSITGKADSTASGAEEGMSPKMKKKLKKHLKKLGWTPDHIDIQYKGKYGDWLK